MKFLIYLSFFLLVNNGFAQTIQDESSVDWEHGKITIKMLVKLASDGKPLAVRKQQALSLADTNLEKAYMDAVSDLYLSSTETVLSWLNKNPHKLSAIKNLSTAGKKTKESLSTDLKSLMLEYSYNLYPVLTIVFPGSGTVTRRNLQLFEASAVFSSLVILAEGDFPVQGENSRAMLNNSLSVRIFDEDMNLIYDYHNVQKEILASQGMVLYSTNIDSNQTVLRAGKYPLYCVAVKIFGNNRTDIVIPNYIAAKIMAKKENRKILSEAKIVILKREY